MVVVVVVVVVEMTVVVVVVVVVVVEVVIVDVVTVVVVLVVTRHCVSELTVQLLYTYSRDGLHTRQCVIPPRPANPLVSAHANEYHCTVRPSHVHENSM